MSDNESLLGLVKTGQVVLIDKKEIALLRRQAKDACEKLSKYKNRMSKQNDLVYECNCEGPLPSCSYIHSVNPNRSPRRPNFCPLDGNGCKWKVAKQSDGSEEKP